MSTKNTPKKNGDLIRTSSQQEEIEDDVLLTQVHKLHFDRQSSSRAETTRLQEEEAAQSYERPARRMLPDEPRDSVKDEKISDDDDSVSLSSSQDQDYFGDMLSSQITIVLTGAGVTLDESSELQNALTTPVVGDSNDNDIAASNWPTAMADRLSVLVGESPIESARSGFDGVTGQPLVEIDSSASVQSLTLTNAAGQALNGEDSGLLTLSGQSIFLFTDTQDSNLVLGKTDTGQVVMAVYLSPTGPDLHAADVWTVLYQPLQHPDPNVADEAVNLAGKLFVTAETSGGSNMLVSGPSGQNLFLMLGNHDEAVVVSGVHPANQSQGISLNRGDTVNSSQAYEHLAIGTNNQMVDGPAVNKSGGLTQGGEGLVITYVTGAHDDYTSLQLSPTEADVEANIQFDGLKDSTHAIVGVNQLQPVKAATVKITALLTGYEPGVQFVDGLLTNDTAVGITHVVVMDAQHNVLEDSNGSMNSASISISFSGGSATVSGITAGHLIAFDTVTVHNRVLIENPGNANPYLSSSFDLGYFSWGESESTTLDIGSAVRFEDAAPSADENLVVQLDDDALAGGISGGDGDVNPDVQNATGTLGYSYGADGGSITWLDSGAPDGFTYVVDGNQLFIEQGETTVMTLTLNTTTGAYTVEQNAPLMHPEGLNENNQNFNVTYQVTDSDGDTAAGQLAITVNDDTPTVSENQMVILDDDALPNGNPGGVNDLSPDTENTTGILGYSYGADGGSMTWLDSGAPDGFTYMVDGNQLFIEQGETTVMTLTLNTTTGAYTVEQNAPLMHPEGLNENNQNFNVTYQVTDSDGDTAAGQLAITVNDDTPTVSENLMVVLDDDALAGGNPNGVGDISPDTQNATGILGYSYGADGGSMTWLTTGSPDGFTYVVDGNQLFIEQGETTVMTLTLNTTTGAYTVEQNAPLMHPEGLNENNQNFNVTYQVTDSDGDTAAGQLAITVNDDTPTVSENQMVILDDDALPNGNPGGVNDLSPDTENLTGTLGYSYGADGGSMTWLGSGAPDGFTYVVDGNQLFIEQGETTVMTLTLNTTTGAYTVEQNAPLMHPEGLNENNQNFNVTYQVTDSDGDTAAGQLAITVNDDTPTVSENLMVVLDDDALAGGNPNGVGDISPDTQNATGILGYSYGADGGSMTWLTTGSPDGFTYVVDGNQLFIEQGETTVMTLTLNTTTGAYTVEQNAPLMHPEGLNENNQNFNVTYQVTDSDGDTAAGQLAITVNDDTPTVSENQMVILDDDALPNGNPGGVNDLSPDTENLTGTLGYSYGADGGSMTWLGSGAPDGFTYVVDGNQLFIEQGETTVMTLTLNTTTGAYTVEQNAPLMHPEGLNENNQNFNVTYQVTDSDGDTAAGQLAITVNDDTPTVSENLMVVLDDDALAGGNPNGVGDISPDTQNATGILGYSYGADGGSITWLDSGEPDGFTYVVDGNQLFIEQGETTVMTLTLNTTTGAYTVEQNAPLMHPEGLNENNQNFNVTYQVTDSDGDTAAGQLTITVNDDSPTVSESQMVILDDDALPNGNPGGVNDLSPDTENTTGILGYSYGADGGSMTWLGSGAPDGFSYVVDGNQLFIEQGETTVMTLTLNTTTGAYTVEQNAPLMHPEGLNENNQNFNVTYQVTDSDGDTAAGQLAITVNDDSPTVSENLMVVLDDDALAGGNPNGVDDIAPDTQNATGTLGYSYGADGGSMTWLGSGAPDGFTYVVDGNQLFIEQGETTVMTLTLNTTTGAYTVEQNAPLMHPEGLNENNQNFNVTYQVTDSDGDTAAGQLAITVNDDSPTVSENQMVIIDDDALAGGNPNGVGDLSPDTENATGTLGYSYGADGGSMTWLGSGAPDGFTYVVDGNQLFIEQGETTVMTLTLNTTTGAYTVEQNAPLMHPEGLNENNQNFNVTYQVTDSDGDTAAGQLAITVNDDSPTVSENLMVVLDDDALAGGNPNGVDDIAPDTQNATGSLGYSYGADGGSMTWLTTGSPDGFTYVVDGNQLFIEQGETTVMTLTLNTTTGAYTVEQNAPLMHPEGLNENNQNFNVTYQITDSDGDTAAGQLAITVNDDTPTVSENQMVILDDDALPNGNPGGVNDLSPDTENATGILGYSYGADGGSITWLTTGSPDGFTYVADGNQLFIEQGETTVMTLTLDTTTGAYTVEQNAPLMHPEGLNENNQNFNVTYQVTDSDGDTAAGQLTITVNDDSPTVSENQMVVIDDDALAGGNPNGVGDLSPDTENATGTLGYSYGADGGSITWLGSGAPDGFTYVVDGNQLFIEQGETTVMTLTLDTTTGAYTVEQNAPLMHPEGLNENNQNFNVTYQVTDSDGDTAAGQLAITVNDDTPTVSENQMVVLDDEALPNGNPGGVNDLSPDTENATGILGYSYGADGGSITWLTTGSPDGFTYVADGNQLFIEQGETTVMTLTLNTTTGAYTVEQNAPLMHPEGLNENNQNFNVTYQVTDSDGDTAAGQLAITVNDDTPIVSENLVVHLDDNALPDGNPVGNEGIPPDIQNTSGTLGHSYGADGGSVTWLTTGSPDGFTYVADGTSLLIRQGDTTIITLSLDTATGEYLAVQNAAVINAPIPGENSQDFQVLYSVTDSDGDISTGQLAITVKDDTPHGSFNEINLLDDDALLGGNPGGVGDVAPDTAFATGNLDFAFGADGGSIAWLTTGAPDGFSYEADGTSLLVKQAGTLVLTLTLDPVSAAYTVVQSAAIQHVSGLDENSQAFTMNYNVLDNDGDSAIGQFYITVNDDTATVGENLMVHLDDDALPGGNPVGNEGIPPDVQNTSGTLAHSYGADGGTIAWVTTGAPDGFSYQADGTSLLIRQGDTTIITLSLDTATGDYLATQNAALINVSGLGENNQDFQVYYNVTDGDGDITTGQLDITVNDDTPHGSFNEINLLDDDALAGGNPGGIGDVAPDTAFATGNLDFAFGADGGSIAWLTTGAPDGFTYEADGTSLLVKQAGTLVLTLTLDPVSAAYTVVQSAAIQHVSGLDENSQAFTMNYNVLDNDGDPAIGQFYITVNDDTPVVTQLNDVWFQNTDNPVPGGDSQFAYSIGADKRSTFSNVDSDFSMFSLRGEVGINSITNTHITWNAEDTTSAVFRFDFDYQPNEASPSTAHAMGTLMFDKVEGTYHINLDQYIQGFNILTTSSALSITGYEANSTQVDKTQPAVSVAELSDGAYVQFTSASEPGGGTGGNNLQVNGVDGDSNHWAAGELFSQSTGWVSISNLSNGVNGDTMQKGEVLNLSLFDFNPYGNLNASPNAGASGMFLKLDGIGSEDLVVVLKLVDTETLEDTTRALIIDNSDILKLGNVLTPDYHIVLDNNDGAVIIESNDFNGVGENFVMTGAQILTSTEGITGSALNFNSQTGVSGASTTAQDFDSTSTDGDVIKISDIGIMTNQTSTLDSHLEFKFAIKDADLDATPTQTLNAYIAGSDVNPLATLM